MRASPFLVLLLLAGCVDPAPTDAGPSGSSQSGLAPTTAAQPTVDADTGSILVSVTDTEVRPIAQVQVLLDGTDHAAFTDEGGHATFNGLEPAKYTVLAAKPGFKSSFEKGKLVEVMAGEITEVKLTMEPQVLLESTNTYHKSLPFKGLIACSLEYRLQGSTGYTSYCARGVTVAGIEARDPNDNSTHPWEVDSFAVQSLIIEAKWSSSSGLNARDLHMGVFRSHSCTDPGNLGQARTCNPSGGALTTFGPSPLYAMLHETSNLNLTKNFGATPDKYPSKVFTAVRAYCGAACTGAAVYVQQSYEAWATTFYGAEAPAGWSVYKTP